MYDTLSRLITRFVTRVTRQMSHVEQEMLTLWEHLVRPRFFFTCLAVVSLISDKKRQELTRSNKKRQEQ
jgi:hypothetical protein